MFSICRNLFLILFSLWLSVQDSVAQSPACSLVLLRPAHSSFKGIPLLEAVPDNDARLKTIEELSASSYIREMILLNGFMQEFIFRKGLADHKEPLYILASGRMGGFPMHGFFLKKDGKITNKRFTHYVDLKDIERDYKRLGSITQIYPHELAHIYFVQLSGIDPARLENYSSDIHYFSILTNYFTAFNEGFAESFENNSRIFEANPEILKSINDEAGRIAPVLDRRCRGFDRDFRWPFRLGIYRLSMILWYQSLEEYKRFIWAGKGYARFNALPFQGLSAEKTLLYSNACVIPDTLSCKNKAQMSSNEGVINSFFTFLMQSKARQHYAPAGFYRDFLCDSSDLAKQLSDSSKTKPATDQGLTDSAVENRLRQLISPGMNQILKEFAVIYSMNGHLKEMADLFQLFISEYISLFPEEKEIVLGVYRQVCGSGFESRNIPELWLLNREHRHSTLVMAQYGGAEIPYYTMNLNTAGEADLRTFRGVSPAAARSFIQWRDSAGLFRSMADLDKAPYELKEISGLLRKAALDRDTFKTLDQEGGLSLSRFFVSCILRLLELAGILVLILIPLRFLFFYFRRRTFFSFLRMCFLSLLKVMIFVVLAVGTFFLPYPPLYTFSVLILIIFLISLLTSGKNPEKRRELILSTAVLYLLLAYSLF